MLNEDVRHELGGEGEVLDELEGRLPQQFRSWDPFAQSQWLETAIFLPGYILSSQGDRMAMARSVEARFPFLDVRVVEYAARLPARAKMRALNEKHILKIAARDLVPDAIRKRKKQPYRAPDAVSFVNPTTGRALPYVDALLSPDAIRRSSLFDVNAVSKLFDKARRGQLVSTKDNMAFVFVLSTQLLCVGHGGKT